LRVEVLRFAVERVLFARDEAVLFARVVAAFARVVAPFARVVAPFARDVVDRFAVDFAPLALRFAFDAAGFDVPARVAADLPACFTASPAFFAADVTPFAAPRAALPASPTAARASRACRVDAAFLPAVLDEVLC
jgi:hypothetical protein